MVKGGIDNSLYKNIMSVLQTYMVSKPKGMLIYWLSFCVWIFRDPNFNKKFRFRVEFQLVLKDCALIYSKLKQGLVWSRHFQDINFTSSMWESLCTIYHFSCQHFWGSSKWNGMGDWTLYNIVGYLLVANIFLFKKSSLLIICKSILNTCMIYWQKTLKLQNVHFFQV
jgi:hypothetical protein